MEQTIDLVRTFVETASLEEARRLLEQHPELLGPEIDSLIEGLATGQGVRGNGSLLKERRALLTRCRELGVEEAFGKESPIPRDIRRDVDEMRRLQSSSLQDPQDLLPYIRACERVVDGLVRADEAESIEIAVLRASVRNNLGHVYSTMPTGDREANLRRALSYFGEALQTFTPAVLPEEYATIKNNIGTALEGLTTGDRRANLLQAIACREEALRIFTPERAPLAYAATQRRIGDDYGMLTDGDRAPCLRESVARYREALRFLTLEASPFDYGSISMLMGLAYGELSRLTEPGDPSLAIAALEEALRVFTIEDAPPAHAAVCYSLANIYKDLPAVDRTRSLGQAIAYYRDALRVWTPENDVRMHVMAMNNLGIVLSDLTSGDIQENLSQAIDCFEHILQYESTKADPEGYAQVQLNLGAAIAGLRTGDRSVNLARAKACYEEGLRFVTLEGSSRLYAEIQGNLGNIFQEMPTDRPSDSIEQAIRCYKEALRVFSPAVAPDNYAKVQMNLGTAYRSRTTGDLAENIAQAIKCYQEALRILTFERAPQDYAAVQLNLGNAFFFLPSADRGPNINRAIECCRAALRVFTPKADSHTYGLIQMNLGVYLRENPTGDRVANLEQAIACLQEALRFLPLETARQDFAKAKINLGNTYVDLMAYAPRSNLPEAIDCFSQALLIYTREANPIEFANVQHNMARAYVETRAGDRSGNLRKAIACYREALRYRTAEITPLDYALTQNNLGEAYRQLPKGEEAGNVAEAIACYREALRFWDSESMPVQYAAAQSNLGNAYYTLPDGDREANLDLAIACYREALRFRTPQATPFECRQTAGNLANVLFSRKEWASALRSYRVAIDAGERLYRAGMSLASRASETALNSALFRNASFAAAKVEGPGEAFLILERGKTRLLAEALHLSVRRPTGVPEETWQAYQEAGAAVRSLQAGAGELPPSSGSSLDRYAARMEAGRRAADTLAASIERVQSYSPDFLRSLDLDTITGLLPDDHTAIVAPCVTAQGSLGFVVSSRLPETIEMVEVPGFDQRDLDRLVYGEPDPSGQVVRGWIGHYLYREDDRWQATQDRVLDELGRRLLTPILAILPPEIDRLVLFPSGELFLLPLHAASLSDQVPARVCDRYEVSYAPSAEVLAACRAKSRRSFGRELYAVVNPQEDAGLPFTRFEELTIADHFSEPLVDRGRCGTTGAVVAGVHGRSYVHFSCHGFYDWNDPRRSGLVLADDILRLSHLQDGLVDLSAARLVTLSACETGIVDVVAGSAEEYVGLPAGFLLAGVPCVVSSLWAVPDLSTALLMGRFYDNHLERGMSIGAALHESQRWVRNLRSGEVADYAVRGYEGAPEAEQVRLLTYRLHYQWLAQEHPDRRPFEAPQYWAAFTANGA